MTAAAGKTRAFGIIRKTAVVRAVLYPRLIVAGLAVS